MKEFGLEKNIFVCTDSTEIFFSKLRSAGLNYNMPSFFTDSYCAGGVSNKHCLLTFFILQAFSEFTFEPSGGELKPLESKKVKVIFQPVSAKSVRRVIEVMVEDGTDW